MKYGIKSFQAFCLSVFITDTELNLTSKCTNIPEYKCHNSACNCVLDICVVLKLCLGSYNKLFYKSEFIRIVG